MAPITCGGCGWAYSRTWGGFPMRRYFGAHRAARETTEKKQGGLVSRHVLFPTFSVHHFIGSSRGRRLSPRYLDRRSMEYSCVKPHRRGVRREPAREPKIPTPSRGACKRRSEKSTTARTRVMRRREPRSPR